MNGRKIYGTIGKIILSFWMLFWWGYLAYQNRILLNLFPSLFLPWDLSCQYFPYEEFLSALIFIPIYVYTGYLLLRCFDFYVPRWAYLSLSFILGLSMIAFLGEICGLVRLFYGWAILAMMIALYVSLLVAGAIRNRRPYKALATYKDDYVLRTARRSLAQQVYQRSILHPQNVNQSFLAVLLTAGIIVILILLFYHALLYPMTYWDSLSYLGMARSLVLNHRFPVKIVAQMGIGTGSNYPQMYRVASAIPSAVIGYWSDWYARLLAPISGLFSLLLVYHIILRLSRVKLLSLALSSVFITIPYGIRYFTLSSDYALCILFTAGFVYVAMMYVETKLPVYAAISGLIAAFACHINYLMPLLLPAWVFVLILAHRQPPTLTDQQEFDEQLREQKQGEEVEDPDFTYREQWETFGEFVRTRLVRTLVLIYLLIICPWYIRNWVQTGNPVYPYFSSLFGGRNINKDVLASMQGEWLENGDGIDKATLSVVARKIKEGKIPEEKRHFWIAREMEEGGIKFTLLAKLYSSFEYFVSSPRLSWLLAPVFLALTIPGILIWAVSSLARKIKGIRHPRSKRLIRTLTGAQAAGCIVMFLLLSFLVYHYLMAGYYLYQIIPILVCLVVFAYMPLEYLTSDFSYSLFSFWCFLVFLFPGLPFALMNFKLPHDVRIEDKKEFPWQLSALRHPCMFPEKFYSLAFGEDANMLDHINTTLLGKKLLTHDNRYLFYDPSITIIHLDDWEIQKMYDIKEDGARLKMLKDLDIYFYLRIPMEEKHRILRKLDLDTWEQKGFMKPIFQAGGNILFRFDYEGSKSPSDQTQEPVYEFTIKERTKKP